MYTIILPNIGLFSLASYKVIALPTIATAIVVALTRKRAITTYMGSNTEKKP